MLHDILDDDHIQWHPPLIGHYTNFWPLLIWTLLPNLTFPYCARFPLNICNGWGMPTEDAYSSGHLVLSHFGLSCSLTRPIFNELVLFPDFLSFERPSVLLFCLVLAKYCYLNPQRITNNKRANWLRWKHHGNEVFFNTARLAAIAR